MLRNIHIKGRPCNFVEALAQYDVKILCLICHSTIIEIKLTCKCVLNKLDL